ncbi:hypothetical protein FXO38_29096 [Capsicum annuum]|nr:hypothetical protein FXO38_29096 [Capsicum annuum]KAF3628223.1 hypothetical protein FXO37_29485 [Capsicum annuum]
MLVENKADLRRLRAVPTGETSGFVERENTFFMETSVLEALNVENSFTEEMIRHPYQEDKRFTSEKMIYLLLRKVDFVPVKQEDRSTVPYISDIPRAVWNPPLTRRGSHQPECAARVGVSDSDMPHGTRPAQYNIPGSANHDFE